MRKTSIFAALVSLTQIEIASGQWGSVQRPPKCSCGNHSHWNKDKLRDFEWREYAREVMPDSTVPGWTEVDEVCSQCVQEEFLDPRLPDTGADLEESSNTLAMGMTTSMLDDFFGDGPFEITKIGPKMNEQQIQNVGKNRAKEYGAYRTGTENLYTTLDGVDIKIQEQMAKFQEDYRQLVTLTNFRNWQAGLLETRERHESSRMKPDHGKQVGIKRLPRHIPIIPIHASDAAGQVKKLLEIQEEAAF